MGGRGSRKYRIIARNKRVGMVQRDLIKIKQ